MSSTPERPSRSPRRRVAVLKIFYLLAVTVGAFGIPAWQTTFPARSYVVPCLLVMQVLVLVACGIAWREVLRPALRLKWLFLFLIACYALLPSESRSPENMLYHWRVPWLEWSMPLNLTGLEQAGLMCLQILTLILASAVVRLTGPGTDLVDGLRAFRFPLLFVYALDQTLALLGSPMRSQAGMAGWVKRQPSNDDPSATPTRAPGFFVLLGRLVRGDVGFVAQSIQGNLDRAVDQGKREYAGRLDARMAHDVAVIAGVSLGMVSLKMLKSLPGIPFAAGHKTLLLFPLYVLASQLTLSRWGGTVAGSIMGVIGFFQGDGRFGVLEILKHIAPGLVIDLARPLVRRLPQSAWVFCLLGLVAGMARTTTDLVVVLMIGGRVEVYIFPAAKLVPNLLAGTLSGFVTLVLLRAFAPWQLQGHAGREAQKLDGEAVPKTASEGRGCLSKAEATGLLAASQQEQAGGKRAKDV